MKILHHREEDICQDPFSDCLFHSDTSFDGLSISTLVTLNQVPLIRQHQSTYLTGRCTSHARDFARMVAGAILAGRYDHTTGLGISRDVPDDARVLWIDTVSGAHTCAEDFRDMKARFCRHDGQFFLMCLDMLGTYRDSHYALIGHIEQAILDIKPTLVVIDDIDHFMPHCGWHVAGIFNHLVRDTLSHTDTAFLFIGYNELGKRANTTTQVGKLLFPEANTVVSLGTRHAVTTARFIRTRFFGMCKADFLFTIGDDGLPHQAVKAMPADPPRRGVIEEHALRDIIQEAVAPGESVTPDQLYSRVNARRIQLNKIDRTRALIAQATLLGILVKSPHDARYTLSEAG